MQGETRGLYGGPAHPQVTLAAVALRLQLRRRHIWTLSFVTEKSAIGGNTIFPVIRESRIAAEDGLSGATEIAKD